MQTERTQSTSLAAAEGAGNFRFFHEERCDGGARQQSARARTSAMAERGCQELAALVLHVAAELISGTVLVLAPQLFVPGEISVDHTESLRGIGNGALSIGLLGLALLLSDESAGPWWAYVIVAQYHVGVVILQLKHPLLGLPTGWRRRFTDGCSACSRAWDGGASTLRHPRLRERRSCPECGARQAALAGSRWGSSCRHRRRRRRRHRSCC